MENKYYTPTLDEFYVGFEYEQKHGDKWKSLVFDINYEDSDWNELYHINYCLAYHSIRVKYLDKEDIESLGFSNYIPPHEYDHTWTLGKFTLKCWFNDTIPHIRIIGQFVTVFDGNIKNKSELVKLLKQIGI